MAKKQRPLRPEDRKNAPDVRQQHYEQVVKDDPKTVGRWEHQVLQRIERGRVTLAARWDKHRRKLVARKKR